MSRGFFQKCIVILILFVCGVCLIDHGKLSGSVKTGDYSGCVEEERKDFLARLLTDFSFQYKLFKCAKEEDGKFIYRAGGFKVVFTVNPELQRIAKEIARIYKLKYAAFVFMDTSGRILLAFSSTGYPDLAMKNNFVAASLFKIITASAGIEFGIANQTSQMVCGGYAKSCSPTVWLKSKYMVRRDMRSSFAMSANPYFGNLGRLVGKERLVDMAERFGFNRVDYGFPWGKLLEPDGDYEIALTAVGLSNSRLSPFHAALIASTIENGGMMARPSFVERVEKDGRVVYSFNPVFSRVISKHTADQIRSMMKETVKNGTVAFRKHFRMFKNKFPDVLLAGKTGTLSEFIYPEGRREWFIGFMEGRGVKISFASLVVNGRKYYLTGYEAIPVIAMKFLERRKACVSFAR